MLADGSFSAGNARLGERDFRLLLFWSMYWCFERITLGLIIFPSSDDSDSVHGSDDEHVESPDVAELATDLLVAGSILFQNHHY